MDKRVLFYIMIMTTFCLTACVSSETVTQSNEISTPKANQSKASAVNLQLAVGYLQQGDIDRAKQKLLLAQKQAPNSPDVFDTFGYFYATTGDKDKAMSYYQKALSLSPRNGKILNNYGVYLCKQRQYQKAIDYFSQAVKDPDYLTTGEAYENAGLCALEIPNNALAHDFFTKALENDPNLATSNLELAKMAFTQKNMASAMFYLKRYKVNAQPSSESLWLEIQLANQSGDQDLVASDALLLKEKFPLSSEYQQFKQSGINL
jgi:type IV pilus assembly protein PilF